MLLISILALFSFIQVHAEPPFACDFEDGTMCEMENGLWFDPQRPVHNFSLTSGELVPDKEIAPSKDHTYNTSSGHFAYWHQPFDSPHTNMDGCLSTPIFELTEHMCLTFAYYIKSVKVDRNGTVLSIYIKGCGFRPLWAVRTDDTLGWQTDEIPLVGYKCNVTIWFNIMANLKNSVSVALDDISVDICARYRTTTTPQPTPSRSIRFTDNISLLAIMFLVSMNYLL
ncbi:unnamed protein product [Adineta ricciae]|uniref:MAM domain-containing protein n=1 Tax=Adineta ricciae TaxID=249248 RepID=A0A816DAT8_ADIRI|nr:unnamed protein product [Adineta ricciae]